MSQLLDRIFYKMGYTYRHGKYRKIYVQKEKETYCGKKILKGDAGNKAIAKKITDGQPFLIARLGSTELSAVYHYYLHGIRNIKWEQQILTNMQIASGFFPSDARHIERFCEEFFAHLHQVDMMGVWYNEGEEEICCHYCPEAEFLNLDCIEPYYFEKDPWSQFLKGKKVLVIHPFEASIRHQYEHNRVKLFQNTQILPEFELKTIKAVQSIAGVKPEFDTWFDAYRSMCDQMLKTDFDIAIIGAGAYGLPLGSFAKTIGKQAIHMGGATQLLFGVNGSRWMNMPAINKFFNEAWKKPDINETPERANLVENACYW